jgi:hypothetical protein
MTGAETCPDCAGVGWDIFNAPYPSFDIGGEIQRCDSCEVFPGDEEAAYAACESGYSWDFSSGRYIVIGVPHE